MKTIKIALAMLMVVSLSSCQFDIRFGQVNGNGNVVTEERPVANFTAVRGSAGIDVFLTKGDENKVVVEADENLLEIIETRVDGNTLKITSDASIGRCKSKKVHVTYTSLESIEASSGADVIGNSVIKSETLSLGSSSGADLGRFWQTSEGSFSAVSTPPIAIIGAFFSNFRDLQDLHTFAPLQTPKF